ncbi:hypothetical protein SRHO_G00207020 [Serrasalmus rhombeus]
MKMQITVYVLLLMLLQKVTCREEQQNKNGTSGSFGVTAVPDVCALIPCAFTDSGINNITKEQYKWYKCSDKDCEHSTEIKDEDFNRWQTDPLNCSVIIDLISSNDTGYYQFRPQNKSQYPSIKVTIQAEKPMILFPLTDGRQATLNCSIPNPCPRAQPQITWKLGGNFTSLFNDSATMNVTLSNGDITSMLTFTLSFDLHGTVVQCVVNYGNTTTYTNRTLAMTPLFSPTVKIDGQKDPDSKVVEEKGARCDDNKDNLLTIRTVFSFLAGASSTAIIVCAVLCCVCICQRCGTLKATDGSTNIKLETVKIQPSQADADNAGANEQTPLQKRRSEEARSTGSGGLEEEDTPGEDRNLGVDEAAGEETKEVDYACIDYSLIQKRQAEAQKPKSEDTEYAEIHIKKQAEGEGDELLQDGTDQSASRLEEGVESQEQEGEAEVEV